LDAVCFLASKSEVTDLSFATSFLSSFREHSFPLCLFGQRI